MLRRRALQEPWRLVMLRRSTPQERIAKASRTLHFLWSTSGEKEYLKQNTKCKLEIEN